MLSLLVAVTLHGAVVTGGWLIGGSTGAIAALVIVLSVEKRLARARALDPNHRKEHRVYR